MKIDYVINQDSLGDINTSDDNARYAQAVEDAIQAAYPEAQVSVSIGQRLNNCVVDNDDQDVVEQCNYIANHVWDQANY